MCALLTDPQTNLLKTVAKTAGIIDYTIETEAGSTKGDGHMGIITTVRIKNKSDPNTCAPLHLVLKAAHQSDSLRRQIPIRLVYLREIYIYETIFPALKAFSIEKTGREIFEGYPKCYASCSEEKNECLILGNLKEIGFKLWDRKRQFDRGHIELVFQEYGKFHAMSLALKEQQPGKFHKLTKNLDNTFCTVLGRDAIKNMLETQLENAMKTVKHHEKALGILSGYSNSQTVENLLKSYEALDEFSVITHEDSWCNNIMFRYNTTSSTPSQACLLDWQISKIASPVVDLSHFFYSNTPRHLLYHYKDFWKIYHNSLSETLRKLGSDPEKIFPFDTIEAQWKKHSKFGLHISFMTIKFLVSESEEFVDREEMAESGRDVLESLEFQSVNDGCYSRRIADLVVFMAESGFL